MTERILHRSIVSEFSEVEPWYKHRAKRRWKNHWKKYEEEGVQTNTLERTSVNYKGSCKQKRHHYYDIGYCCENYLHIKTLILGYFVNSRHDFLNRRITDLGKRYVFLLLLVPDRSTSVIASKDLRVEHICWSRIMPTMSKFLDSFSMKYCEDIFESTWRDYTWATECNLKSGSSKRGYTDFCEVSNDLHLEEDVPFGFIEAESIVVTCRVEHDDRRSEQRNRVDRQGKETFSNKRHYDIVMENRFAATDHPATTTRRSAM